MLLKNSALKLCNIVTTGAIVIKIQFILSKHSHIKLHFQVVSSLLPGVLNVLYSPHTNVNEEFPWIGTDEVRDISWPMASPATMRI